MEYTKGELKRLRAICLRDSKVLKEALKRKHNKSMIAVVADTLQTEGDISTPPDPQHGREPESKSLTQYLGEYLEQEKDVFANFGPPNCLPRIEIDIDSLRELLEQALDAYQSIENVTIKIERN